MDDLLMAARECGGDDETRRELCEALVLETFVWDTMDEQSWAEMLTDIDEGGQ